MYQNYSNNYQMGRPMRPNRPLPNQNQFDDRLIGGGFLGPFILGGITGGLLAPSFYPNRPYYNNYNYYYPYPNYYYYGGYYR